MNSLRNGLNKIERLSQQEWVLLNTLALLVGCLSGYAAIGFRMLISFFQNGIYHQQIDLRVGPSSYETAGLWIFLIAPLGFLLVSLLTRYLGNEAKGHGVPEVMEAVLTKQGRIRTRIVALKALVSSLTIASGGSVGREGPIVQIGSAAGSSIGQFFKLRPRMIKTLVGCGAAGAIAATFNTPIAGVIFAFEIILLELRTRSFVPLAIASVFATIISRIYLGNTPAFAVPAYSMVSPIELAFYLGLGLITGLVGVFMIKTLYGIEDLFNAIKLPFFAKSLLGGLLLGLIGFFFPQVLGVGYETISNVLHQNSTISLIALFIILKILAMSITLAAGGSGGIFAPSLFVGAMVGGAYGWLVHHFFPDITASYGAYALVGMAAVFAAASRAAFTSIVILFEMTLDYSIILPLIFVCVLADQIAWAISKNTIYSFKLKRKGIHFVADFGVDLYSITSIRDVMTTKLCALKEKMTLAEARSIIIENPHAVYPVVDDEGILTGVLSALTLENEHAKPNNDKFVSDLEHEPHNVSYPEEPISSALKQIEKDRDPRFLVVERGSHKLLGIISPIDLIRLTGSSLESLD
jgi:CIC family chloride channel protein